MRARSLGLLAFFALSLCGCMSQRYAGQYDGGNVYDGIGDVKTCRKFYIRSLDVKDGYRAKVSAAKIQEIIPELLNRHARPGDIPIDVNIIAGEPTESGGWTTVFLFFGGIIPMAKNYDQDVTVVVAIEDMSTVNFEINCRFVMDAKMTVFSPLGGIPYSDKEGFQENQLNSGGNGQAGGNRFFTIDASEVFSRTIARAMAAGLKKFALERLELPDIEFDAVQEDL